MGLIGGSGYIARRIALTGLWAFACATLPVAQAEEVSTCVGQKTVTLASGCANTWLKSSKSKSHDLIPSWRTEGGNYGTKPVSDAQKVITRSECSEARLTDIDLPNRVALIKCKDDSQARWINLDNLTCSPTSVDRKARRKPEPVTCPVDLQQDYTDKGSFVQMFSDQLKVDDAVRRTLIKRAKGTFLTVQANVDHDNRVLTRRYLDMEDKELMDRIWKSAESLSKMSTELTQAPPSGYGKNCDLPEGGDSNLQRAHASCKRFAAAADMAFQLVSLGRDELGDESEGIDGAQRLRAAIADLQERNFANADDEAVRMALFYGLDPTERDTLAYRPKKGKGRREMASTFKYIRETVELGPDRPWIELHDGYELGGSRLGKRSSGGGIDCSEFVAGLLLPEVEATEEEEGKKKKLKKRSTRVGFPTTLDFRAIYDYLELQRQSKSSRRPPKIASEWKNLYRCFEPVNLREGDRPQPTDLIGSRNDRLVDGGHIVFVDAYDPDTGVIHTVEAAGGPVDSTELWTRPLYEDACRGDTHGAESGEDPGPPVRPDLFGLRFIRDPDLMDPLCPLKLEPDEG